MPAFWSLFGAWTHEMLKNLFKGAFSVQQLNMDIITKETMHPIHTFQTYPHVRATRVFSPLNLLRCPAATCQPRDLMHAHGRT